MIELLEFSHDRNAPYEKSCDQLREIIDDFADLPELGLWYSHFEKHYGLPKGVVQLRLKSYVENLYHQQKCIWSEKLNSKSLVKSILKQVAFFAYARMWSKNTPLDLPQYDLIVEGNISKIDLQWFSKLMDLFGQDKALAITLNPISLTGVNVVYRPQGKFYDREEVSKVIATEIRCGWKLNVELTKKLKVNFGQIALHIIDQYLYYYSLFKRYNSKFLIQMRHYQTSSIKNHLFRKFGGICSTSIQKNIHQMGRNGFYYDIDTLFSIGKKTTERAFQYGARIKQVVPVGSLFMENMWFGSGQKEYGANKEYDIVYLGINASAALYCLDAYDCFCDDYYDTFKWLADFSRMYPELKIGIKHHSNNRRDGREMDIVKNSNVERIDQKLNSYAVAFSAKSTVSFGSTMGYELIVQMKPPASKHEALWTLK